MRKSLPKQAIPMKNSLTLIAFAVLLPLAAGAAQMMNHRGPEFAQILRRVTDGLNWVFGSPTDVLSFTTSGTGGLEVAIVNTLSPGDRVLSVSIGSFGDRLKSIARTYGADVVGYATGWGEASDATLIAKMLDEHWSALSEGDERIPALLCAAPAK